MFSLNYLHATRACLSLIQIKISFVIYTYKYIQIKTSVYFSLYFYYTTKPLVSYNLFVSAYLLSAFKLVSVSLFVAAILVYILEIQLIRNECETKTAVHVAINYAFACSPLSTYMITRVLKGHKRLY